LERAGASAGVSMMADMRRWALIEVRCNAPADRLDPRRSVEMYHQKTTHRGTASIDNAVHEK
jgi:hypothetical protein